jgi:hypothetical protein
MPSCAFSGTQFTRPDRQREAFRGLDVETLHIVPATANGSDDSRECGLKVRYDLGRRLGEGPELDGAVSDRLHWSVSRRIINEYTVRCARAGPAVLVHVSGKNGAF